jgi:hypothetical protein
VTFGSSWPDFLALGVKTDLFGSGGNKMQCQ